MDINPPLTVGDNEISEIVGKENIPLTILTSPDQYHHGDKIVLKEIGVYFVNRVVNPPVLSYEPVCEDIMRWIESPVEFFDGNSWRRSTHLYVATHADIIRAAAGGRDVAPDRRVRISFLGYRDDGRYEIYVPADDRWVLLNESTDTALLGN